MPKCIELPESIMKHNTTFKNPIIFFYKKNTKTIQCVTNSLSIPLFSKVVVRMKIKTMKHAPPFLLAHRLFPCTVFIFCLSVTYALTSNIRLMLFFCYQAIQKFTTLMTFELYHVPHTEAVTLSFHILYTFFLLGKLEENNEDLMRQERNFPNLFAIVCTLLEYENIKIVLHASFISSYSPSCFLFQICLINKTQSKGKCLFK